MAKAKALQNTLAIEALRKETGLDESHADEVFTNIAYMAERVLSINDVCSYHGITTIALGKLCLHACVRIEVKKLRVKLVNSGAVMRKTALAALHKNKDRLDNFLGSDLNASSHATIANLAYKLSGLEAKDKRAERDADSDKDKFTIILNIGPPENEPMVISGTATGGDDIEDGEVISEDK